MTTSQTHETGGQATSHYAAGVGEAASNLADFWQHQLKRIKERAEDLKGSGERSPESQL
jgi:gas vesicle protein